MTPDPTLFLTAFAMGFAFCGPPGPVLALATRRGVVDGFTAALMVEFGSLVGDAVWALLGLSGAGILMQVPLIKVALGVTGAALLAWLGVQTLRAGWRGRSFSAASSSGSSAFATGAVISLANPQAVAYWLALGGSIPVIIGHTPGPSEFVQFFCGFMLACVAYCFLIAALIAGARNLLTDRFFRIVNGLCGVTLVGFAVLLLYDTVVSSGA